MPHFSYKVRTNKNEIIQSELQAININSAAQKLENKGYIILELKEISGIYDKKQIKQLAAYNKRDVLTLNEKVEFFNGFYARYKSGLSLQQTFEELMENASNKKIRALCAQIVLYVTKGNTIKEGLKKYSNALGLAYTMLIAAGEESGKLQEILSNIIDKLNNDLKIRKKIITTCIYPGIMLLLCGVAYIINTYFVRYIFTAQANGTYDNHTISNALSGTVTGITVFFAILILIAFLLIKKPIILTTIREILIQLPILNYFAKMYDLTNFFSVMSLSYSAGLPMVECVYLGNSVIKFRSLQIPIKKMGKMLQQGCEITTAFRIANVFSKSDISNIQSGSSSGELDKMFKLISENYTDKLDIIIKSILNSLGILLLLFVGAVVFNIVLSGYNAYFSSLTSFL